MGALELFENLVLTNYLFYFTKNYINSKNI